MVIDDLNVGDFALFGLLMLVSNRRCLGELVLGRFLRVPRFNTGRFL